MKYQLKEKAWRMTFLVFATCALFSCSDDENDPSRDDNEPPLSEATVPTPNPYLASEHYSLTHFNSAQTDAFPYAVKGGTFQINPDDCASTWSGAVNLMTLSSTDPDYMWGMCSDRVSYIHIADGTFERVAEIGLPNGIQMNTEENLRKLVDTQYTSTDQLYADAVEILGKYPQMSMSNGNYVICDNENYAYTNARTVICRYKLKEAGNPKAGIVLDKQVDMAPYMDNPQTLVGMVMTYDGYLVVASGNGIAIIDRTMSMPPVVKLIPDDQVITNSAAVDEHNGARVTADKEGYQTFIIPDNVGGRFSVLTPVGLLPIAVAGFDIEKLVEGARTMETICGPATPFAENPAAVYAATRNELYKDGKKIEILVNFNPKLHYMNEWWKQLYGESEGKDGKGIYPSAVDFSTDLHSMGQWIQEGERTIFETVISIENPEHTLQVPSDSENLDGLNFLAGKRVDEVNKMAELGTQLAHVDGGVPNMRLIVPELNEYYLGEIIYFFEKACGISGYLLGVNPFNQPGVEAYKKNMFALLNKPGYEEESKAIQARL